MYLMPQYERLYDIQYLFTAYASVWGSLLGILFILFN